MKRQYTSNKYNKNVKLINRISTDYRNMLQWVKFLDMTKIEKVIDLTGGAGGESLYFVKLPQIEKVISYELDQERYQMFEDNIKTLTQKEKNKITLYNKDSTTSFGQKTDLILFDPPWTFSKDEDYMQGKRKDFEQFQEKIYKEYLKTKKVEQQTNNKMPLESVNLKLGSYDVQKVIDNCVPNCKYIALKIPLNCIQSPYSLDYQPIKQQHSIIPICYNDKIKYLVIIITGERQ